LIFSVTNKKIYHILGHVEKPVSVSFQNENSSIGFGVFDASKGFDWGLAFYVGETQCQAESFSFNRGGAPGY